MIATLKWPLEMHLGLWFVLCQFRADVMQGVTMVGIHERSAREKIFSNQVARKLVFGIS
jgi:hypothetical protein